MTLPRTTRRVLAGLVVALLALTALTALAGPSAVAGSVSESSGRPDPVLGRESCKLMDRVYVAGGCSRTQCRHAGEQIRYSPNAETCTIGGRTGTSYGSEIDSRTCARLHRRFVTAVNFCAANPHREQALIFDAPQCVRPYTTYVTTSRGAGHRATRSEAEGRYDVCVRPQQAHRLEREAAATGRKLRNLAVDTSAALTQPGAPAPTVLMVGDSLTWRGTNELAARQPDWVVDGASGRNLDELADRISDYVRTRGAPTGLIVALGTNPAPGFSLDDLRADLATLPVDLPVMVVTPFREVSPFNTRAQVRAVAHADDLVTQLALTRPHTCVADWAAVAAAHPSMLVDGTHQTRAVESTWATFVSTGWQRCLTS